MLDVSVRKSFTGVTIDAAFTADAPGITALFGRSGAGKSSVIAMIAGLLRPDTGHVTAEGATLFDAARRTEMPPERRRVGLVFQDGRLFPHLSVRRNLRYGMDRLPPGDRRVGFDHVVALLGLESLLDRRPGALSGGEKQRVAMGRALLASPRLLLMDEPLAALDAERKAEVMPFIRRLAGELEIPILYVSHATDEILALADRLVLMDDGRSVAAGPVEDLMSRLDLRPLTGRFAAGAVVRATVAVPRSDDGLTGLDFAGGRLWVPAVDQPAGRAVRLRIHARDVALALTPPADTSVQNIFPATVAEIAEAEDGQVDVRLDAGCPLWARVTRRAVHTLGLEPGRSVHAMIKSVAVARREIADHA